MPYKSQFAHNSIKGQQYRYLQKRIREKLIARRRLGNDEYVFIFEK